MYQMYRKYKSGAEKRKLKLIKDVKENEGVRTLDKLWKPDESRKEGNDLSSDGDVEIEENENSGKINNFD